MGNPLRPPEVPCGNPRVQKYEALQLPDGQKFIDRIWKVTNIYDFNMVPLAVLIMETKGV